MNQSSRINRERRIMVTGASSGIGRATAALLASKGHHVFAAARRERKLRALADEYPGITPVAVDVTDQQAVDAAWKTVDQATSGEGLDVLVNAAGNITLGPVEATSDALARRQFEVNLFGLLAMTRAVLPSMRAKGSGRIVNVSSFMARLVLPGWGLYSASKVAVDACSCALRMELSNFGIDVVVVEPGMTDTNLYDRGRTADARSDLYEKASAYPGHGDAFDAYLDDQGRAPEPMWGMGFVPERLRAGAVPPDAVARVVARAAVVAYPRARYVVGWRNRVNARIFPSLPTAAAEEAKSRIVSLDGQQQGRTWASRALDILVARVPE